MAGEKFTEKETEFIMERSHLPFAWLIINATEEQRVTIKKLFDWPEFSFYQMGIIKGNTSKENIKDLSEEQRLFLKSEEWKEFMTKIARLSQEEVDEFLNFLNSEKQSVSEWVEECPELEDENFKIDSANRKEMISPNGIKVKVNPEWDVREYVEGDCVWEQLFTARAALREVKKAGKKLPVSWIVYETIIAKKYKWDYQDFLKGEKIKFCGWYSSRDKKFRSIGGDFGVRFAGSSNFVGDIKGWIHNQWDEGCGLSVRCLKKE